MEDIWGHGDDQLSHITLAGILDKVGLSDEDREILILRFGHGWYYDEIAEFVGIKHRGESYTEGTIRYRLKNIMSKLEGFVKENNLK